MRALVVYESMYGNTHLVADAIADGLRAHADTDVRAVADLGDEELSGVDLLVVGAPTHVHGLPRPSTRRAAVETAAKPDAELELEPEAEADGVREWFASLRSLPALGAAFDTRIDAPAAFTGRASKAIAKRMRERSCETVVPPESFLVSKQNVLLDDEQAHARAWGDRVGAASASALVTRH